MSDSQTTGDEVAGDPVATPATDPVIESVGDLVNLLGTLEPGQQTWYREQVDRGWPLVPSAMRKAGWFPAEGDMLKLFRQEVAGRTRMSPAHEWDWVCLAQHHRLPTRLLDWSTNPLLGLYFAAEFDEGGASDAEGGSLLLGSSRAQREVAWFTQHPVAGSRPRPRRQSSLLALPSRSAILSPSWRNSPSAGCYAGCPMPAARAGGTAGAAGRPP